MRSWMTQLIKAVVKGKIIEEQIKINELSIQQKRLRGTKMDLNKAESKFMAPINTLENK